MGSRVLELVAEEFSSDSRPTVGIAVDARTLVVAPIREGGPDIIKVTLSLRPKDPRGDVFELEKLDLAGNVLRVARVGILCVNTWQAVRSLASWIDAIDSRGASDVGFATAPA
ncbi:hypothetical protein ACWEO1_01500 [Kitasatospora cineracea]